MRAAKYDGVCPKYCLTALALVLLSIKINLAGYTPYKLLILEIKGGQTMFRAYTMVERTLKPRYEISWLF